MMEGRTERPRDGPLSRGRGTGPESEELERTVALTRKMLRAMGIDDEKIDQIIEAHGETVDALKAERDGFRADAERLQEVEAELEKLKAKPDDGFKERYEKEHADFEAYKAEVKETQANEEKSRLYRDVLRDAGIDPKRIDSVMRVADLSAIEVKDGAITDRDEVVKQVGTDWADFVVQSNTKPATVPTPPASSGGSDPEPHSLAEALRQKYAK